MHKNSLSGYLFALTAVFFWSINLIIASSFATSLMPMEIAFGRWLIAGVILLFIARKNVKESFSDLLRHWKLVLALAVTGMVFDNTLVYMPDGQPRPLIWDYWTLPGRYSWFFCPAFF
mgnify:CR=1 FL=1